ncbi:hypothetical protein [Rhodopirellula halodulae]|nr:hypothetical protein [Rhodopirellula sp. JC740]
MNSLCATLKNTCFVSEIIASVVQVRKITMADKNLLGAESPSASFE